MLGMLDKDRKGAAIEIILGKLKGEKQSEPEGNDADLLMASDEILAAIEAKDSTRLKDALYGFVASCSHGDEAEETEPEGSEPEGEAKTY